MLSRDNWPNSETRLCAVIGNPVAHSLSPAIHNAAFKALGLNYVYVAFRVEDVEAALGGMRGLDNFRGMSVTIPHKVAVMRHLDEVSEIARMTGSVNTITNEKGRLRGTSTDGAAALEALRASGLSLSGKEVVMLGSGGAARAIAFSVLKDGHPESLTILGIVPEELGRLVEDLRGNFKTPVRGQALGRESLSGVLRDSSVLINCTPVGMTPRTGESIVGKEFLRPGMTVFDIVYTPARTRLVQDAEASGCRVVSGVEMFVNQAALQFREWTGVDAPREVMKNTLLEALGQAQ